MKILYCTYVRPHLEFAIQAWCPYLIKDIKELENIQKRATKTFKINPKNFQKKYF